MYEWSFFCIFASIWQCHFFFNLKPFWKVYNLSLWFGFAFVFVLPWISFHVIICCMYASLEKYLSSGLKSISIGLLDFFFLMSKNLSFLYISYTYHLLDIWFANILSQSVACACTLLTVFNRAKVLNFYEVQFINFSLYGSRFWCSV